MLCLIIREKKTGFEIERKGSDFQGLFAIWDTLTMTLIILNLSTVIFHT